MQSKSLLFAAAVFALVPAASRAGVISYDISMNTAPLIGDPAGPFSLDFQLDDGSGTGNGNNTAVLSDFNFGGGAPAGAPSLIGGATGNAGTALSITESSFFNEFVQQFTPGSRLDFHLQLSTNLERGGVPDEFSFAILDNTGSELPTRSFFDVFLDIDINSSNPSVQTFASNARQSPVAGGPPIHIAAPTARVASVPEPGTVELLAPVLILGWLRARLRGRLGFDRSRGRSGPRV